MTPLLFWTLVAPAILFAYSFVVALAAGVVGRHGNDDFVAAMCVVWPIGIPVLLGLWVGHRIVSAVRGTNSVGTELAGDASTRPGRVIGPRDNQPR